MVNGGALWPLSVSTARTLLLLISCSFLQTSAQSISTNAEVPPLQWINLSDLLKGSKPQPVKDAAIGYDGTNVVIFGGESAGGISVSTTYLLNLQTLTWSQPQAPGGLTATPPPRSAAVFGQDSAASYRNGLVVVGGRDQNGKPLNDVWEFDYTSQFWGAVSISGDQPPARWGAAGGNDRRTPFNSLTLTTSLYVAGGFTADGSETLSDIWQLDLSGTLSSNNPTSLNGKWTQTQLHNKSLPQVGGAAGAVVFEGSKQHIAAIGGCSTASGSTAACAQPEAFVLDVDDSSNTNPSFCPPPRVGAAIAPNLNTASSTFAQQVFLLLGTLNTSQWQDDGGLRNGEVDVFNIDGGTWARILPAGDPGDPPSGQPAYPPPREGPAVLSLGKTILGSAAATDTLVFGGRDSSGNYLNDVWILRAYNGSVSGSSQSWSGFGSGQLQGGPNANGEGVKIQYMTSCAQPVAATSGSGSSNSPSPTSSTNPPPTSGSGPTQSISRFDTSVVHKSLAPVSAALVLPAIVFYRLSQPSAASAHSTNSKIGFFYLTALTALVAFALGIGGLATAFTSLQYTTSVVKRSAVSHLATPHGRAGIALFVGLYGLVPVLIGVSILSKWKDNDAALAAKRQRTTSNEFAEKVGLRSGSPFTALTSPEILSPESRPVERVRSGDSLNPWPVGQIPAARRSSESAADDRSSPSTRSFEVTNRPQRARHASAHSLAAFADPRPSISPRNLSDMSWLERRRSLTTVGDMDYANSHYHRAQAPSTPGTAVMDMGLTAPLHDPSMLGQPIMPNALDSLIHLLLHAFLLALCILSIIALWQRANVATFAVFLVWTVCFYLFIFALAWNGIPSESILTVIISRLKNTPPPPEAPPVAQGGVPFPRAGTPGPYQNHPAYRTAHDHEYPASSTHGGMTVEDDDDDDAEESMNRREVALVTVPKRRLVLVNPGPS